MNFLSGFLMGNIMGNLLNPRSSCCCSNMPGNIDSSLFGCGMMGEIGCMDGMDAMFGMNNDFGMMGNMGFGNNGNITAFMQMFGAMFGMACGYQGLDLLNFMNNWSMMCNNMGLNSMQGLTNAYQNMQMQSMNGAYGFSGVGGATQMNMPVGNYGPYVGATNEGERLAQIARVTGGANGTRGKCLKGVNDTLQRAYGFRLSYPSAYMAKQSLDKMTDRFVNVTHQYQPASKLSQLPPGAIVVWDKKPGHPHGHISISLGNGQEASDHIQKQITGYGSSYTVYMPKDGVGQQGNAGFTGGGRGGGVR